MREEEGERAESQQLRSCRQERPRTAEPDISCLFLRSQRPGGYQVQRPCQEAKQPESMPSLLAASSGGSAGRHWLGCWC